MKEKYIEERFPRYFIFGMHEDQNFVDVADVNGDVVTNISVEDALVLIKKQDQLVDFLFKLADRFDKVNPKEFKKFWYEEN